MPHAIRHAAAGKGVHHPLHRGIRKGEKEMNDKYFDVNLFEELPADHFHKKVLDHATCIAANLMFDAAHPDHTGGVKSANAYHMMIALCEAGLKKLDEKDVAESREFVAKVLTPITKENEREMCREFMAAIFGIK
nr:MAG TPA: hypothetical protein [Caudoviricetes sp.]